MTAPRLVMASGSAPGAGKSTLIEGLLGALRARGDEVAVVMEDEVWGERRLDDRPVDHRTARSEFVELLHAGRPLTPSAVAATFDRVATAIDAAWWLQDWTWQALTNDDVDLDARLSAHRAIVLHLRVDPEVAVARAVAERGPTWLRRHATTLGLSPDSPASVVAGRYRWTEEGGLRRLVDRGVTSLVIDASRRPDLVLRQSFDAITAAP